MSGTKPEFHLMQVQHDGTEVAEVYSLADLPAEFRSGRRGFLATGVTVAAALAVLDSPASCAEGEHASRSGVIHAHTHAVTALRFSPDGTLLISSSRDGTAKLWSMPAGKLSNTLKMHRASVNSLAIDKAGTVLATGSHDSTVRQWSLPAGEDKQVIGGHASPIRSLAMATNGKRLVSASLDGQIRMWSMPDAREQRTTDTAPDEVSAIAVTTDDQTLLSGTRKGNLQYRSFHDGRLLNSVACHQGRIDAIAVSSGGWMAMGATDRLVTVRKITEPAHVQKLEGHKGWITDLAFSPDGSVLASVSHDATIKLWTLPKGDLLTSLQCPFGISAVAISPSGTLLAAGDVKGAITLWDLRTGRFLSFLFDPAASSLDAHTYEIVDSTTQLKLTFTLPCGTPIPAGATCTCNCVSGTFKPIAVKRTTVKEKVDPLDARKEALQILRQKKLARLQAQRLAAEQQAYLRWSLQQQYMSRYRNRGSSGSSSSGSTRVCICIPVYR